MKNGRKSAITRRDFAKASAAAAGFAILSSKGASAQDNVDTLKVGLLGCGGRGTGAAMDMLTGDENVRLIALADLFQDKVDATRNRVVDAFPDKCAIEDDHCFVGWDAYRGILETDIDIVIEGTLPYSRPKHIEAAVNAKKHIFTEKPAASDPVGIRKVIEASNKHKEMGLSFVAGTQRRHQKPYIETIKKIHDGAIGEVRAFRAYWCGGLPFARERDPSWGEVEYRIRNWYNYCWASGDNIVEQHVHNLDVCNWVMNAHPVSVFASGGRNWKPREEKYGDLYDHFSCDFEYENGVHMVSFSRHWNGCAGDVFEEAVGTQGVSNCHDMAEEGTRAYVKEHIDLVNSIRGAGPYCHEGVQVAASTLTAIMGRMSAYTGKKFKWDEALNADLSIVPDPLNFEVACPVGPIPVPVSV